VRKYGEEKMALLDRLGHASSLAASGEREPSSRIGWETVPSSAPAYDPLPKAE
jgi:RecB family exonuclease